MTTSAVRSGVPAVARVDGDDGDHGSRRVPVRLRAAAGYLGFAALVYVPLLLTAPGRVVADTKSYLYLDPERFLGRVASLWDPNIGLGTVSHQNIGYLFPLGPFYWVTEVLLGLPAWVAQRLWLGSLLFAAGLGVRYLLRTLGVRGPGVPVAVLAFALSPYALEFSSRLSVLLGPWAALPWLLAFTILAVRAGPGWKYPALIALTIQLVGGVNATALLYALLGPAAWLAYVVVVRRDAPWRRVWAAVWRITVLATVTSLWWAVGLFVEGSFGMGILRFTESIETVSATSTASEILRGLGYWFFYGGDVRGPWNDAVLDLTRRPWLIAVSFLIPALALVAAGLLRWRDRAFFVLLVILGMVVAVAASPYDDPTALGSLFKVFATSSTAGFALRSTARAVPLMTLGLAVLLGVGISALWARLDRSGRGAVGVVAAVIVGALCIANAPGLWNGRYYSSYLERDETLPAYWRQALAQLDARGGATRVLAIPGADFAAYRWGDTIDPIEPGLIDRPYVARELVPWGGEASTNLLIALDRRLQERSLDPRAIAPIARLMGVGDVAVRFDLQTDQFTLVTARDLWHDLTDDGVPAGLDAPKLYGTRIPGSLQVADVGDPSEPRLPVPKPVAVFGVTDPQPIVRAKPAGSALVVDGDGEGLVDLASAGLLDASRLVVLSPTFESRPAQLRDQVGDDTVLVVTDSNRRRGMRWAGMRNNYGYTEAAGEQPLREDLLDQRLEVFPGSTDASRTVTELRGVRSVRATTYGTPAFGYTPEARPAMAIDGDPRTAWEVDAGVTKVGPERIRIELDHPITTDRIGLLQANEGPRGRWVTRVGLRFDDGPQVVRPLDVGSRSGTGQTVTFPERTFSTIELQIKGTVGNKVGQVANELSRRRKTGVGFAEITLRNGSDAPVRAREVTRMPTDLLASVGARSAGHPLAFVMSRTDRDLWRRFTVPTARSFAIGGSARLNRDANDDAIDRALGIPGADEGGITVTSRRRATNVKARASAAFDGDLTTSWTSGDVLEPQWVDVTLPAPTTVDRLDLRLVEDGRHSVPTRLRITAPDGTSRVVDVPPGTPVDGITSAPVTFAPLTGDRFRIQVEGVRRVTARGAGAPVILPVGVAEFGLPGVQRAPLPAQMPDRCLTDQLLVDGVPTPVRASGSTADALAGRLLAVTPCPSDAALALGAGAHELHGRSPRTAGVAFDRIVLSSGADGAAVPAAALLGAPAAATGAAGASGDSGATGAAGASGDSGAAGGAAGAAGAGTAAPPRLTVVDQGRTSMKLRAAGATEPYWLVLGQSLNRGWHAQVDGHDLGAPQLVDGFANGWRIDPHGGTATITLDWTPQRSVWIALAVSILGVLACLGILVGAAVRRRRAGVADVAFAGGSADSVAGGAVLVSPWRAGRTVAPSVTVVATSLGAAVITGVLVRPVWGVVVGVLVAAALLRPRARIALRLLPATLAVLIGAYTAWGQLRHRYPASFEWPTYFERARNVAWLAVLLLVADVVVGRVLRGRRSRPPTEPGPTDAPDGPDAAGAPGLAVAPGPLGRADAPGSAGRADAPGPADAPASGGAG
jgi:hypothetical protein